jgi:hypothetical protein
MKPNTGKYKVPEVIQIARGELIDAMMQQGICQASIDYRSPASPRFSGIPPDSGHLVAGIVDNPPMAVLPVYHAYCHGLRCAQQVFNHRRVAEQDAQFDQHQLTKAKLGILRVAVQEFMGRLLQGAVRIAGME